MTFSRFVTIGRVALINYGPDAGKLATIIDVVDENKALVDGPFSVTGVNRHVISFKRLALTDLSVKIPRQAREATLKKALEKADILNKWAATSWSKKTEAKKTRAGYDCPQAKVFFDQEGCRRCQEEQLNRSLNGSTVLLNRVGFDLLFEDYPLNKIERSPMVINTTSNDQRRLSVCVASPRQFSFTSFTDSEAHLVKESHAGEYNFIL
ncbi:hypothetical protein Ae201684_014377 [Aphanomyces euteiches]|uniref:Large ribosomal subunit protein eL14 domain-containing protein n=1 Tax=Aphanomyces euteiches TaxID=100861 RepID=A0A6G0WJV9_9STRA|nr:hypothetical protein Ae201684_014377 [Aphanomyces euteiches]